MCVRMTKGLWRIDNAEIVTDIEPVIPIKLLPNWVKNQEEYDSQALRIFTSDGQSVTTYPGDKYQFLIPC